MTTTRTGQSRSALDDPIYQLDSPIYLESSESTGEDREDSLRFSLHVDIDGDNPLGVISGTVAFGVIDPDTPPPHFIGKVTSDTPTAAGCELVVENFRFKWPTENNYITRLDARVSGSVLDTPFVDVTFVDTAADKRFGPFRVQQGSTFFRDIEVDVDREQGSVAVEPYDTLQHPDRPANLQSESLTLESAYAKAGIRVTRAQDDNLAIVGPGGPDMRWTYRELHDSMEQHWTAFENRPQWKMWVFLANLGQSDQLGGVMFDGDIDEPGGIDRQGTAIFTKCPHFHTELGDYIVANPPTAEAMKRELFFNLIHETGHAFNLAHSFQKNEGGGRLAPSWMPLVTDAQALSWMNCPDAATPSRGAGYNASWFYKRFRFRFDDAELLFLRYAPENYVQMGNAAWFVNHGRVSEQDVDPRLHLQLESPTTVLEYGQAVLVELRLMNRSDQIVNAHENLNLSDGFVEIAITAPDGRRQPFIPISHTRAYVRHRTLEPQAKIHVPLDLTVGKFGFPFKKPGAYRVEACFTNVDGRKAAAVPLRIYVRSARDWDLLPPIHSLFDARVGRVFYVKGSRVMEDTNDRLEHVKSRVTSEHPLSTYIDMVRVMPLAETMRVIGENGRVKVYEEEPDEVVKRLQPIVAEKKLERTADSLGNINLHKIADTFVLAAEKTGSGGRAKARTVLQDVLGLFTQRKVTPAVLTSLQDRVQSLS